MSKIFTPCRNIWVPKFKILEAEIRSPRVSYQGEYTLVRRKADTEQVIQTIGPFCNLITDIGLEYIGATGSPLSYVFVGTGTLPASPTDEQMGSFLAATTTNQVGWNQALLRGGPPDYWVQGAVTKRFSAGAAAGNLTEVGIGWGNNISNHRCFSRALIVDGGGAPTSITVLSDEVLDVTYAMRAYPYIGPDLEQVVTISGQNYDFTTRSALVGSNLAIIASGYQRMSGAMYFKTGTAAGTPPSLGTVEQSLQTPGGQGPSSVSQLAYVPASLEVDTTITSGLNDANLTYGIRGYETTTTQTSTGNTFVRTNFQTVIDPPIMKNNTQVLSFGMKFSWGRYVP